MAFISLFTIFDTKRPFFHCLPVLIQNGLYSTVRHFLCQMTFLPLPPPSNITAPPTFIHPAHRHYCPCLPAVVYLALFIPLACFLLFTTFDPKWRAFHFLVADEQLYKRLCPSVRPSVRPSVGPLVSTSRKVEKPAFPPLPTRPQLMAVYPALLNHDSSLQKEMK